MTLRSATVKSIWMIVPSIMALLLSNFVFTLPDESGPRIALQVLVSAFIFALINSRVYLLLHIRLSLDTNDVLIPKEKTGDYERRYSLSYSWRYDLLKKQLVIAAILTLSFHMYLIASFASYMGYSTFADVLNEVPFPKFVEYDIVTFDVLLIIQSLMYLHFRFSKTFYFYVSIDFIVKALDSSDDISQIKYLKKAICYYNNYLRKNIGLEINVAEVIKQCIARTSEEKIHFLISWSRLSHWFDESVKPILLIKGITGINQRELLSKISFSQKIKDNAFLIIITTIIVPALSILNEVTSLLPTIFVASR